MKIENEITVLVLSSFEELHKALIKNGFETKDKYTANDYYMISNDIDLSKLSTREILKHCFLVREITGYKKVLLYKHKEFDSEGNILVNGKIECPILDIDQAIEFMKAINYRVLMEIHDKCTEYVNDEVDIIVQDVNDKYLFFEVEEECRNLNKKFSSLDEIKDIINKYDLPFSRDNYFVKKAEIVLDEILKRK